jgi:hypothetical protein
VDQIAPLPAEDRNDPFFGINDALAGNGPAAPVLRGMGASIDRVEARWDRIEPAPNEFDFVALDGMVDEGQHWGYQVVLVVDGAPGWAVDAPALVGAGPPAHLDQPAYRPDGTPNPANPWAAFLVVLARRYGTRVNAWEVWNEENFRDYWHGAPEDYARLLKDAGTVLRREARGATILVGGMVEDNGDFFGRMMAALCPSRRCPEPPFDGVAWHVYGDPGGVTRQAALTREVLAPYHLNPSIWITEANVAVDDPLGPPDARVGPDAVSPAEQAAFVAQTLALARSAGVRSVAIYRAGDVPEDRRYWGLLRSDMSYRPALLAYRTTARWLAQARFERSLPLESATTALQFARPDAEVDVLWSDRAAASTMSVPATADTATLVHLDGSTAAIQRKGSVFSVPLPAAPPARPGVAPLGQPVFLVVPRNSGA